MSETTPDADSSQDDAIANYLQFRQSVQRQLLCGTEGELQPVTVSVQIAGRRVAECTIDPSALFAAVTSDNGPLAKRDDAAAIHVAAVVSKLLFENTFEKWVQDLLRNEAMQDWLRFDVDRLCALLQHWEKGRDALHLPVVQQLMELSVLTPLEVTKVAKAFERGMRSRVMYTPKRGNRPKRVDPTQLAAARALVGTVREQVAGAKKEADGVRRREKLLEVLKMALPGATGLKRLAADLVTLEPKEIAIRIASRRYAIPINKIRRERPVENPSSELVEGSEFPI
jgi:hypothetical protein